MVYCVWKIFTVQQGQVHCCFHSFVFTITAKQVDFKLTVLPLTPMDSSSWLKKAQNFTINEDELLGKVLIGNANQPICVPGNSALTILGRLGKNTKVPSGTSYLIDTAVMNNLLQGISVNHCLVHPNGRAVPVILMNQNNYNVWIWQPLLAAEFIGWNISHGIMGLNFNNRGKYRGGISAIATG